MVAGSAVVDVETTGIHPGWNHRVVEVAVVRFDVDGRVVDEWCTLVNPERDMGPQHVHGITVAEARVAPSFGEIAGDLASRLAGNLVVDHNVSFDLRFLAAEFGRSGLDSPLVPDEGLCTMALADRYPRAPGRSLGACCEAAAVARSLGLARADVEESHRRYLVVPAKRAWADAVVTEQERDDLGLVAVLLGLGPEEVERALAADPDSLSGKAKKAAAYGIPVVTEAAIARLPAAFVSF